MISPLKPTYKIDSIVFAAVLQGIFMKHFRGMVLLTGLFMAT
jgi:hypothetical protein